MHTILVPVDGSVHAMKALHIACDLARKYDGRIALLYVLVKGKKARKILRLPLVKKFSKELQSKLAVIAGMPGGVVDGELLEDVGYNVIELSSAMARRLDVEVEVLEFEKGSPADCILLAQRRLEANTIVMGSRGVGDEHIFGSASYQVFQNAPCTCIAVK